MKPWELNATSTMVASDADARKTQYDGVTETLLQFWNPNSIVVMVGIAIPTGLLGGTLAFFVALAFELPKPFWYLLIGGILATLVMWGLILVAFFFKILFPQLNFMVNDKNHNGIPDFLEKKEPVVINMTYVDQAGNYANRAQTFEIPATPQQLKELAIGTFKMKRPFAIREWAGQGKPFSDLEFRKLQDTFANDHFQFLILKNPASPNQGYLWTQKGLAALQKFLPETHAGEEV